MAALGHLPAKFYDSLKEQRDRFDGSSKRMSKVLAKETILRYMNNDNEGHKEKFKPGFDPQVVATPHCEKGMEEMADKILNGPRERTIEEMKEMGKEIMLKAFGESITALSEGFVGGEVDGMAFV